MSKMFAKSVRLTPSTMSSVAERRFGDAEALRDTGLNARANGVVYLTGFVIEILLKAQLIIKYPLVANASAQVNGTEAKAYGLVWKSHDLEKMLNALPELQATLRALGERDGTDYAAELKKVCGAWTIQARYASKGILMDEATEMLERVRSLKEKLK